MPLHHCELCHIDLDRISVRRGGQIPSAAAARFCSRMCPCISTADSSPS